MKRAESQKACLKKEILDYVLHTYGTSPDYPWKTPDFVLRHNDNGITRDRADRNTECKV